MKPYTMNQHGSALLVALMFLVILTLLSVQAMRTSTMELRMAGNEQERRLGFDSAQSAVDAMIAANKITVGSIGDISCFGFGSTPTCSTANTTNTQLNLATGTGDENVVRATLKAIAACPRSSGNSYGGDSSFNSGAPGGCAYYDLDSTYDATARRGGRVVTQEGFVKLLSN